MKKKKPTIPADKKDFLLAIAGDLFAENGFDATSVRMIAEKSGMNIAMISYYFGSKEKLYVELILRRTQFLHDHLNALNNNDTLSPWEKIEFIIDAYSDRIIKNGGAFHKIMMREISLGQRTEISEIIEERIMFNMRSIHKIIEEGIRKKIFRKNYDFMMLMSTMIGTITQAISSGKMNSKFKSIECGRKQKPVSSEELSLRVKKHLRKVFAAYLLVHPEKYKY